ncbi:MAG TPA: LysR substrate-binding domain-containing protein [Acidobacteriaceae bacterium]|nr:LysR substrate-binding domain-containing protein [Acidobacteriaceae bacterium]
MELRHLRYFVAVAENGGFGRAAQLLHVAQSAISEQIRDLEAELGAPLFDRNNRNVRLTPEGDVFLADARAILAQVSKAAANIQKSLHGEVGTLTIGFFAGGAGPFFPAIIKEFRSRFPEVQVALVEMAPLMQHQALQAGTIDIGFTRALGPQATALRSEHFLTERLYAVLPKTHRMAKKRQIAMRDLADERFVLNDRQYSAPVFDKIITLCTEAGFSPRISATGTVSSGVLALVEAGAGVAILPGGSRRLSSDELVFVPLADRTAFVDLVIAWSPAHDSRVVQSFLDLVRKKRKKPATSAVAQRVP